MEQENKKTIQEMQKYLKSNNEIMELQKYGLKALKEDKEAMEFNYKRKLRFWKRKFLPFKRRKENIKTLIQQNINLEEFRNPTTLLNLLETMHKDSINAIKTEIKDLREHIINKKNVSTLYFIFKITRSPNRHRRIDGKTKRNRLEKY